MLFRSRIRGDAAIIMHSAAGIDTTTDISRQIAEIAAKRGSNRTTADDIQLKRLECQRSFWLDESGRPTVPGAALRTCIEAGARKLKQGPLVREGLIVQSTEFGFDGTKYGDSMDSWRNACQFTVPVVVQRSRVLRTRARFDTPWTVEAVIFGAEEIVDAQKIETWLDIAGQRVGLGDWRPACSGAYGRFSVVSVEEITE